MGFKIPSKYDTNKVIYNNETELDLPPRSGSGGGSGGDSDLPTYDSGDAGKVLAVNSGGTGTEWSDISEIFIIEVSDTDSGMVLNKTYTEIHQAMVDGKIVFVINPIATGTDDDTYKFFGFVMETYFASGPPSDAYVVQILQLSEFGLTKLTFDADTVSDYPSWSF